MNATGKKRGKKLLILASKLGYQTRAFSDAAETLGVEVVFGTDRCHQLEDPWGDRAVPLHFENPQQAAEEIAHVAGSRKNEIGAVLALGDRATPTAACVARLLGLRGNTPESAAVCRSKLRQREVLRTAGLPIPDFFSFALREDPDAILSRVKFPCVVKPLSLAASQGVIRANDAEEFRAAVRRIRALLESPELQVTREPTLDRLLVEEYIPGIEAALEGLLEPAASGSRLRVLAIFDKPDPLEGPFFEETIYVTPSRLDAGAQASLMACAELATQALGLTHGPVHAEFRTNAAGPWVLEIAPRPIGGLCSRALNFGAARMSLEELLIRQELGLGGSDVWREETASGVMMIPVPRSGIFQSVAGVEEARRTTFVEEIVITARVHDYVAAWPEGASYLGFIFARAAKPAEVEAALRAAHAKLNFVFSPRLPVEHPAMRRLPG